MIYKAKDYKKRQVFIGAWVFQPCSKILNLTTLYRTRKRRGVCKWSPLNIVELPIGKKSFWFIPAPTHLEIGLPLSGYFKPITTCVISSPTVLQWGFFPWEPSIKKLLPMSSWQHSTKQKKKMYEECHPFLLKTKHIIELAHPRPILFE